MANLISVERASLALGTDQVLDGVSLGVGGGDRIGIVGRNGGGKTTLMRVLAGDRAVVLRDQLVGDAVDQRLAGLEQRGIGVRGRFEVGR